MKPNDTKRLIIVHNLLFLFRTLGLFVFQNTCIPQKFDSRFFIS